MQYDLKHHHLAFLLSLGAMPVAGCTINGDDDDDTNGTTLSTTVGNTDASAGTEPGTNSNTNGDTGNDPTADTGNDPSADTGADTAADTGVDTGADDTAGTGGEIPAVCNTYASQYATCLPDGKYVADAAEYCAGVLQYAAGVSPDCVSANEDFYACLGATDCATWTGKEPFCVTEGDAIDAACGAGTTGDESSSSGG